VPVPVPVQSVHWPVKVKTSTAMSAEADAAPSVTTTAKTIRFLKKKVDNSLPFGSISFGGATEDMISPYASFYILALLIAKRNKLNPCYSALLP